MVPAHNRPSEPPTNLWITVKPINRNLLDSILQRCRLEAVVLSVPLPLLVISKEQVPLNQFSNRLPTLQEAHYLLQALQVINELLEINPYSRTLKTIISLVVLILSNRAPLRIFLSVNRRIVCLDKEILSVKTAQLEAGCSDRIPERVHSGKGVVEEVVTFCSGWDKARCLTHLLE